MNLTSDKQREKFLLALGGGLVLSGFIPTPADAWNFHRQRILRQKLVTGEITPKKYWQTIALNHYGYNTLYWLSVLGISFTLGENFEQRKNIFLVTLIGGAVFGVLTNNIKKDEEFFSNHKMISIKTPAKTIPPTETIIEDEN